MRPVAIGVNLTLRPYQDKGLNDIRRKLQEGKKAVLYVLPCGAGKTVTYAAMAAGAASKGNRVLILEHRKELVRQASTAVGNMGIKHQVVSPPDKVAAIRRVHIKKIGWPMVANDSTVAVASVQTLAMKGRMKWLEEFDPTIIVIDEAHHAVAGTWKRIIDACPNAIIIGVTATPCRSDGQGLSDVFDCMVIGPTMSELIEDGYLLPFKVFCPPRQFDATKMKHRGGDIDAKDQEKRVNTKKVTGSALQHYTELTAGKEAIVFCCDLKHAEDVATEFKSAGYRFEPVFGNTEEDVRDARIGGLETGELQGIVTVDIAGEGTDIPCATVGIMLRLTDSEGLFIQQACRVGRPVYAPGFDLRTREGRLAAIQASGKTHGWLFDHVGNVGAQTAEGFQAKHGFPHWDREWTLEGGSKRSRGETEPAVKDMQCPKCYCTHDPAPKCPDCGHVYVKRHAVVEVMHGELLETTDDGQQKPRVRTGMAQTKEDFKDLGISGARADHILAARRAKEAQQIELRQQLINWSTSTGRGIRDAWGFNMSDIREMKPKQLGLNIQRVGIANQINTVMEGRLMSEDSYADLTADQLQALLDQACENQFLDQQRA
jgi:superfamily II DNA or RNA helicase